MSRSWVAVVPVKRLDAAKSRLGRDVGELRSAIALAMALDTITVVASLANVRVVVVTDDEVMAQAVRSAGADVIADEPQAGINAALSHGARGAHLGPDVSLVAMAADLPALRRAELMLALTRASAAAQPRGGRPGESQAFLADALGTGTTLYTATSLTSFAPRFGPGSAAAHAAVAHAIATEGLRSVRHDVDTLDDLRAAVRLGLGSHTAEVAARLGARDLRAVRPAS